jgi:hypothetical protein
MITISALDLGPMYQEINDRLELEDSCADIIKSNKIFNYYKRVNLK